VAWSMECDTHYPHLRDPGFLDQFDLTMTYRLDSDVPVTYVPAEFREMLREPVAHKPPGDLVNAFISSAHDRSGRCALLREMMDLLDVHSYGRVLRNRHSEADDGRPFKMATIARYRFTLAFENAIATDYVTEKFFDPLLAGSVPVYLGAPNIDDFAPGENCFIDASAWDSAESLARHLVSVAHDDALYRRYTTWRNEPFKHGFETLVEMNQTHAFARLCRAVDNLLR